MQESHDTQSIIEAAKQAAAANDYISAEALLRRAVVAQETALGPLHPDLASTVNNLGIVCEINDKPVDAEACFRRAFTIATHAFDPDHPMVATSRQNLRDFCDARGKPFELPAPSAPPRTGVEPPAPQTTRVEPPAPQTTRVEPPAPQTTRVEPPAPQTMRVEPPVPQATRVERPTPQGTRVEPPVTQTKRIDPAGAKTPPVESRVHQPARTESRAAKTTTPRPNVVSRSVQARERPRSIRPIVMASLGPVVMLIAIVAARPWLGSTEGRESAPTSAKAPTLETQSLPSSTPRPTPVVVDETPTADSPKSEAADDQRTTPTVAVQPTVVRAQLCAAIEDWHCDPPDRPVPAGQLFFYTQVKSARGIAIQHRWYQGDRLQHVVDLRVEASTTGYRSFSRYTMSDGNAGNWRVELRSEDGVLLQEERFVVQ